jgi:ABC-type glycerol-3-phosphate transport system permease component
MRSDLRAEIGKHGFILLILLFSFYPLFLMLVISFKDVAQFNANPFLPTLPLRVANWSRGWDTIHMYIFNTVFVAISTVAVSLLFSLHAAYFFARYRMPGSGLLWFYFLILLLTPAITNLIPLFTLLRNMNLLNTLMALILVGVAGGQVLQIYILRNFIEDLPRDLFDAAEVDGASHFQQIRQIVLPLSGSIISTLAILQFIAVWNEFILPLVVIRDDARQLLAVGLMKLDGEYVKLYGELFAALTIASIPLVLLFIFTMRLFVRGLSAGALKG